MDTRKRPRAALLTIALACSLGLSACGGSTVTSDEATSETSVAPLERSPEKDTTEASDSSTPPSGSSAADSSDQGAKEIEEIPEPAPAASERDERFLTALSDEGIDTSDYEGLLVSTGWSVCSDDAVANTTPGAVAGQLVAQERTDATEDEIVQAIESHAREIYCP